MPVSDQAFELSGSVFSGPAISEPNPSFALKNSPALQQSYNQNDHGNDQKNVDQAADMEREKSQGPKNDQDD